MRIRFTLERRRAVEQGAEIVAPGPLTLRSELLARREHEIEPENADTMPAKSLARDALEPVSIHRTRRKTLGHGKTQFRKTGRSSRDMQEHRRTAKLAW